jgi:DNA-binding beta-propeller fold protein YncE
MKVAAPILLAVIQSACSRFTPARAYGSGVVYAVASGISLPGDGEWDHVTAWSAARRLFVSHDSHIDVLSLDDHTVVGTIPGLAEVHGIAIAPELRKAYTSNGGDSSVTVVETETLTARGKIKLRVDAPDGIVYDPVSRRVFTFNASTPSATVIDATADTVVSTLRLTGAPDGGVPDGRGKLYVALKSTSEIAVIDGRSLDTIQRWRLAPCKSPDAMAMDTVRRRLIVGCTNRIVVVLSAADGRVVASFPIGDGVDGAVVDATGTALIACGDGTITVLRLDARTDTYAVAQELRTQRGARTVALDEQTGEVYLPTASFTSTVQSDPTGRRSAVSPESFTVLRVAPDRSLSR